RAPTVAGALDVLEQPNRNVVVNLLGLGLDERPAFFSRLLPGLQDLRSRTGRPHWIVVDEAHHLLPASSELVSVTLPRTLSGMMLITVHPEHVAPAVLSSIDIVVAIGKSSDDTLRALGEGVDDETWLHHLRLKDYSRWFREAIKDEALASEAVSVEEDTSLPPRESRALIRVAIERRYTLPP